MLIKLKDGAELELSAYAASTGYHAETITLTAQDAASWRRMLVNDPHGFVTYMHQFCARLDRAARHD